MAELFYLLSIQLTFVFQDQGHNTLAAQILCKILLSKSIHIHQFFQHFDARNLFDGEMIRFVVRDQNNQQFGRFGLFRSSMCFQVESMVVEGEYPKYTSRRTSKMTAPGVKFDLPKNLADKAASFPESSYGVSLVTLVLKSRKHIPQVHVAWGSQVIKATQPDDDAELSKLDPLEIADVLSEP